MKLTVKHLPPKASGAFATLWFPNGETETADVEWNPEDTLAKFQDELFRERPDCISFEVVIAHVRAVPLVQK